MPRAGEAFLAGLADPDKIIGTLRLKDFHALRVIVMFILVGMLGVWVLGLLGAAHTSIQPTYLWPALLGGIWLGAGFGLTPSPRRPVQRQSGVVVGATG